MDKFFVSLLLQDEAGMIGIAFLLIIGGAIAAAFLFDVKISYRRVAYLWFIALSGLALTISQFLWFMVPAAVDAGLLSILMIVTLGSFALFGGAYYFASAARARDISGTTSNAWLGFVPLANFWLLFKSGGAHTADPNRVERSRISRYLFDPLLVVGAILVMALSQGLDKATDNTDFFNESDNDSLRQLIAETQTLEESFALEARLSGGELPIRIDDMTVFSEIEAQGKTLRMTYDIEKDISGFRPDFKAVLAKLQCTPEMFGYDLARGGTIELIYRAPGGRIIESYAITQADCTT